MPTRTLLRFPPNPDYGGGIFRRRIRTRSSADAIEADLLDNYHEMRCRLALDGHVITGVTAAIERAPFTTCPAAPVALNELIGLRIDIPRSELFAGGRARRNCTHLFDVAALSLALRGSATAQVDFTVPDLTAEGEAVTAALDGKIVHSWIVDADETILAPEAGRSLFGGFSRWAEANFDGIPLELALNLQKAVQVARGRRYLLEQESENSLRDEPERIGACFTFSEPQFSTASAAPDYIREFPEGLPD